MDTPAVFVLEDGSIVIGGSHANRQFAVGDIVSMGGLADAPAQKFVIIGPIQHHVRIGHAGEATNWHSRYTVRRA